MPRRNAATNYRLLSAEALSRASANFHIPSRAERSALKKGDLAKLIFEQSEGERMWVLVTHAMDSDGFYTGKLDNYPTTITGLKAGDKVRFRPLHVIAIDKAQ